MSTLPGTLFLIPVPLADGDVSVVLPAAVIAQSRRLQHFVAENAKTARAMLKRLETPTPLRDIAITELNEHTAAKDVDALLAPLLAGHDVGLMSEAGCPGVADPGALLVAAAHRRGIRVTPLTGPSSLLLALMASGLNGQKFAFHGYLPTKDDAREKTIKGLEKESRQQQMTQLFIETPYRNRQLLDALLRYCAPETRLCLARDLTGPQELISSYRIDEWKKRLTNLGEAHGEKLPTVFLLLA